MDGRYVWIWELSRSEKGDVDALIQKAKDLNLGGYILKAHDGSSFWQQAHAVQELKSAGISCGAWGYCYGKNVSGEIAAIKKVAALEPDFYVLDIEAEFEPSSMRSELEQLLNGIKDVNVPLGYTSFAIPSYHTVPFDLLSRYCKFAMPQIYWALMGWNVMKAYNTSMNQYRVFGLPVYPVGQITSDVAAKDIVEFNSMCSVDKVPVISYWDYQEAGNTQFAAIRTQKTDMTLEEAVAILTRNGIILSPDYWVSNAVSGMTVNGGYTGILITRMAEKLSGQALTV